MRHRASPGLSSWGVWLAVGVVWGLLCVGVRHVTLRVGVDIQRRLVERHEELSAVQDLERRVAEARQFSSLERRAAAMGFVKPRASQIAIIPPERGFLARLLHGPGEAQASTSSSEPEPLKIRSLEEVVVDEHAPPRRGGER